MLKERVISAAIGLPLLLLLLVDGPHWAVMLVFLGFVGLSTFEMVSMLAPKMERVFRGMSDGSAVAKHHVSDFWGHKGLIWLAIFLAGVVFLSSEFDSVGSGRDLVLFGILGSILIGCFIAPTNESAFGRVACLLLAVCYGSLPWLAIWDLYVMGGGARYVILLLAIVWIGDTGAYFGGRTLGKRPLSQRISPKKTWEGAIAGMAASLVGGLAANGFYHGTLGPWGAILVASLFGGIFGQLGDLVESTFKRFCGVKDSGALIPGHGGFLDRVDGLLFAAPVVWFILNSYR